MTKEVKKNMESKVVIKASRMWDGIEAAHEIVELIGDELKDKPSFVLIFTTIHYKEQIKEILKILSESISKKTPFIGGTIPGFITNSGVFVHGIVVVAYWIVVLAARVLGIQAINTIFQ